VRVCCLFLPFASFLQSCSISCGFMVAFPFHSSSHGERSRILEGFLIFGCSVSVLLLISMRAWMDEEKSIRGNAMAMWRSCLLKVVLWSGWTGLCFWSDCVGCETGVQGGFWIHRIDCEFEDDSSRLTVKLIRFRHSFHVQGFTNVTVNLMWWIWCNMWSACDPVRRESAIFARSVWVYLPPRSCSGQIGWTQSSWDQLSTKSLGTCKVSKNQPLLFLKCRVLGHSFNPASSPCSWSWLL
jgi:hypothetical protein